MSFFVARVAHQVVRFQRGVVDMVALLVGPRLHDWDCALGSDVLAEREAAEEVSEPYDGDPMVSDSALRYNDIETGYDHGLSAAAEMFPQHTRAGGPTVEDFLRATAVANDVDPDLVVNHVTACTPRVVDKLGVAERDTVWRDRDGREWKFDGVAWCNHYGGLTVLASPTGLWAPYTEVLDHPDNTPQFPPVGAESPVPPSGDGSVPASAVAGTDHPLCGDRFGRYGCNRPAGHDGPHELAHLHGCVIKRWTSTWGIGVVTELTAPGCVHTSST